MLEIKIYPLKNIVFLVEDLKSESLVQPERILEAVLKVAEKCCRGNILKLRELLEVEGYASHTWQLLKRELADVLVPPILEFLGGVVEEVYMVDLHGGEPANYECMGDKDLDIVLKVSKNASVECEELEELLEEEVSRILSKILGVNVKEAVKIPNIIEIHLAGESTGDYVRNILNSKNAPPILLWRRSKA